MKLSSLYIIFETNGYSLLVVDGKKDKINIVLDRYYPSEIKNTSYKLNQLCFEICDKIRVLELENHIKIAELICVAQSSEVLLMDVELLSKSSKKEVENLIDIKLSQIKGLDSKKFIKHYEKIEKINDDFSKFRICIFPRYVIELMKNISKLSKKKCREIYASYDIVDSMDISDEFEEKTIPILEFRKEDIVLYIKEKSKVESMMTISTEYIDSSLISYLSRSKSILCFGNKENQGYKLLEKEVTFKKYLGKYALIEKLQTKKKDICNFYEKEESKSFYMKALKLLFLILIITSIKTVNVLAKNTSLENEKETKKETAINQNREEGLRKNKNFKNIYGVDIWKVYDISSVLSKKVKNIDIDQEKIVFEFLLSDKSQIKSILREKALEGAELEYIRTEEISLNEAEQIYGIGENNKEGNQKSREENNNQGKLKEKVDQEDKEEGRQKNNQEKSNQGRKDYTEEKNSKEEARKKDFEEKNGQKNCWEKTSKKEKENILKKYNKYLYSYAEESIESIEVIEETEKITVEKTRPDRYDNDNREDRGKNKEEKNINNYKSERDRESYKEDKAIEKEESKDKEKSKDQEEKDDKIRNRRKKQEEKDKNGKDSDSSNGEKIKVYIVKMSIKI